MIHSNISALGGSLRARGPGLAPGSARRPAGLTRLQASPRGATKVAGPSAAVLDAIKRSPLMLELPSNTPGLAAVASLPDDMVVASCVYLLRQHGFMDAKEMIRKDVRVLLAASKEAARIEAEEAAARAAAILASADGDDLMTSDTDDAYSRRAPAGWGSTARAPAARAPAAPAAPRLTGPAARVADALRRSPLMLELPAGARGLDAIQSLSDELIIGATVSLLRKHGLLDAKAMVAADLKVLLPAAKDAQARWQAEAAERAAEAAAAEAAESAVAVPSQYAAVADALKRSPLMLEISGDTPGLDAVAGLSDELIVGATVSLLRKHGLMDAKAMVAADLKVLLPASKDAQARWQAEAAERAAEAAAAAVPSEFAAVVDALKRSPLMLDLAGDAPGLDAVKDLSDSAVTGATVVLLRRHGLMDAKAMVAADLKVLIPAAQEAARIDAAEAAARAAALAEAEAEEQDSTSGGYGYSSYSSGPRPTGEAARVADAIKRSPLMLDLPAGSRGLSEVAALDDAMIVASCVLLLRVEGLMDAKEMVRKDASILLDVSEEVKRIEAEEAAARAAEEAAAAAAAAEEEAASAPAPAARPSYGSRSKAPAGRATPRAAAPKVTGEAARVLDAIKRSPLMLDLPSSTQGLSKVAALDDAMIIASCVLLMRVEGFMDAKEMVASDPTILLDVAEEVKRIEAEEAAAHAAEEAAAAAAAAAEEEAASTPAPAARSYGRAAAPRAAAPRAPVGEAARVLDAIKRSPLMLDLPSSTQGLSKVAALDDAMIIASCVLLMRVEGFMDAKEMVASDPTILLEVAEEVKRIEAEEAAARAAEAAAAAEEEARQSGERVVAAGSMAAPPAGARETFKRGSGDFSLADAAARVQALFTGKAGKAAGGKRAKSTTADPEERMKSLVRLYGCYREVIKGAMKSAPVLATAPLELLERKKANVDAAVDASSHPDWRAWAASSVNSTTLVAYAKPGLNRAARLHFLVSRGLEGALSPARALMMPSAKWDALFPAYAAVLIRRAPRGAAHQPQRAELDLGVDEWAGADEDWDGEELLADGTFGPETSAAARAAAAAVIVASPAAGGGGGSSEDSDWEDPVPAIRPWTWTDLWLLTSLLLAGYVSAVYVGVYAMTAIKAGYASGDDNYLWAPEGGLLPDANGQSLREKVRDILPPAPRLYKSYGTDRI